ncbi:MAG TPA: dipeptidase [Thermomicrobiales bacterium]|nr:dipeptidase [Thermomicrobiales bacterium]
MAQADWRAQLDADVETHVAELLELLHIPSISTDPAHKADVLAAANWVADRLRRAGVPTAKLAEVEGGHPSVIGRWEVSPDQPTLLIYGHYDVQPAEPLELWESPPFEPAIREGRIYARGSSDMKGNLLTAIQGVEAVANAFGGKPPINIAFIFEGEEEIGSPSFTQIIRENRDLLRADAVISADGGQYGPETPSLTVAFKGLGGCQVNLTTANSDLHSGMYGASVPNAVQAMVQLAATFHDADGRVQVAGFYDKVKDLTAEDRAEIARAEFDEEEFKRDLGLDELWGEAGWTPRERIWGRPTLDLNGIWGGFQGEGTKTVTPNQAHLKITCRLVPDQDPQEIVELIRKHVEAHRPPGATVEVVSARGSAKPYVVDRNNEVYKAAGRVLKELFGVEPVLERAGGTIPATGIFKDELGLETIGCAWSQPGSGAHAPNEWYRLEDFTRGRTGVALLIEELAR